jgi:putative redox protein
MRVVARRQPSADGSLGFAHEVEIEGGHTILVDEPVSAGGSDTGPSPTRLLAASLAACTAVTIEMYAGRKGWDLGAVEVDADVAYDGHAPTTFEVTLHLPESVSDEQRKRLLAIAGRCPVHRALSGETEVTIRDRVEAL